MESDQAVGTSTCRYSILVAIKVWFDVWKLQRKRADLEKQKKLSQAPGGKRVTYFAQI